jgi:glycosyltransferase involved in cell wall biosynthesis
MNQENAIGSVATSTVEPTRQSPYMKIALIAPSPVPFILGGAENLWLGLLQALNRVPGVEADLIKLPSPERDFWEIVASYEAYSRLALDHFDQVISTKYPAWMARHPNHVVYVQHKLRGLYDTYPSALAKTVPASWPVRPVLRRLLEQRQPTRDRLPELFGELAALERRAPELPAEMFALPGPLIRAVVHTLDGIALAPTEIRRYCAISRTVAGRADYFPEGVAVEVFHHPTSLEVHPSERYETIFTASRLESPKRVGLIVEAYLRSGVRAPLRIAGEGPDLPRLRDLAKAHPGVEFLGRVTDRQLIEEYARALFVPFVPIQEDYGLITVEAMGAGKAVLTTRDAGGVTELVRHGENGWIAEPMVASLAQAMRHLVDHRQETLDMGLRAQADIAAITWAGLAEALITPPHTKPPALARSGDSPARRPRLLVVNTFPVYPPLSGGQQRLYHLYRRLADRCDVTLVNLAPPGREPSARQLVHGFKEILVPKSHAMQDAERALERKLKASVGDIAAAIHYRLDPDWLDLIRTEAAGADRVIATHPYGYPAIRAVWDGPVIYEAHNVEFDLKRSILKADPEGMDFVKEIEGSCARQAPLILACSEADARRLREVYGLTETPIRIVPNGVDCEGIAYSDGAARRRMKQSLGLGPVPSALFMGSLHGPNIEAAVHILSIAARAHDWHFFILGSVCHAPELGRHPSNVHKIGVVSETEKRVWLSAADVGLNPMTSGSGTNLKLLDFAAVGLPILSTPFGARGGILEAGAHYWEAEPEAMPRALGMLMQCPPEEKKPIVQAARARVEALADWRSIARRYAGFLFDEEAGERQ